MRRRYRWERPQSVCEQQFHSCSRAREGADVARRGRCWDPFRLSNALYADSFAQLASGADTIWRVIVV